MRFVSAILLFVAGTIGVFDDHADVGATPKKGDAQFSAGSGEYRVSGGGENMWFKTDALHYVWKRASGDVAISADVRLEGAGTNPHRKAVLMIRQSLDADSAYADAALHGDGLTSLQYRPASGELTAEVRSSVTGPRRLRLERRGNEFTLYAGNPGDELKTTGPATVILHDPIYVGLGVCSHDVNVLETAVFSNVTVEALK